MQLLDTHSEALDSALRQAAVKALILLRNRGQVSPMEVLPLFFRLFRCRDKALRQMLFSHIVAGEAQGRATLRPLSKQSRDCSAGLSCQATPFTYSLCSLTLAICTVAVPCRLLPSSYPLPMWQAAGGAQTNSPCSKVPTPALQTSRAPTRSTATSV